MVEVSPTGLDGWADIPPPSCLVINSKIHLAIFNTWSKYYIIQTQNCCCYARAVPSVPTEYRASLGTIGHRQACREVKDFLNPG